MKLVKKGKEFSYILDELEREYPGPITNHLLLKDFNKYLRDDDSTEPCNFQLKTKVLEGKNYKLMSRKCWNILKGRFDGFEIKRVKDTDTYMRKFTIKFSKVCPFQTNIFLGTHDDYTSS